MFSKTIEKVKRILSSKGKTEYADCIIRNEKGEIYLMHRSYQDKTEPGKWCLPGGHVDPGEDAEKAAYRELEEETGFKNIPLTYIDKVDRGDNVSFYYEGFVHSYTPMILDNDEHYRCEWVSIEDIHEFELIFDLKEVLMDLIPKLRPIEIAVPNAPQGELSYIHNLNNELLNNGGRTEELFYKNLKLYKSVAAYELIKRAFDRDEIDEQAFSRVFAIKKSEDFLELVKSAQTDTDEELQEIVTGSNIEIEKAKKDISRLKKVKKLITRGGKTFVTTVYVKTGEVEEEIEAPESIFHFDDITVGEKLAISRRRGGSLEGEVYSMWVDKKGKAYFAMRGEDGKPKYIMADSVTAISKRGKATSPSDAKTKESPKYAMSEDFDPSTLIPEKRLGGSSDVKLVTHDGLKFALKKARTGIAKGREQLKEEALADAIYRECGVSVPFSRTFKDGEYKMSNFVYGQQLSALLPEDKEKAKADIQKSFVLDCLLANWDVIGQGEDNIIWDGTKAYRIDNGGALRFRAKGASKTLSPVVSEIDSMRNPEINPVAARHFGTITDKEIARQVRELDIKKILATIETSDVEGKDRLLKDIANRYDFLKKRVEKEAAGSKEKPIEAYDKSLYKSATTANYFKDWDDLELDGNEGIKDKIKKNILRIEKRRESEYKKVANELGMSIEAFKEELQAITEKIVAQSDFFVAVETKEDKKRSILSKVFSESGRFKSQFETRTSGGALSPSGRAMTEEEYFSFSPSGEESKRPIYGYFTDSKDGIINDKGTIPPRVYVSQYGNTFCKIKKSNAMKKATITGIDSLGEYDQMVAVPAAKPHFTMFPISSVDNYKKIKDSVGKIGVSKSPFLGYVETQYHGGLGVDDVESIHIPMRSRDSEVKEGDIERVNSAINQLSEFYASIGKSDIQIKIF